MHFFLLRRLRSAPRLFLLGRVGILAATVALFAAGCDLPSGPQQAALLEAPAPNREVAAVLTIPETELSVVFVADVTTSADRFAEEAKAVVADRLASWLTPGRGGLELHLNRITFNSYDANNELFSDAVPGLPEKPALRQTLLRPSEPDFASCQQNVFGRAACEAELTKSYNAALREAVADEEAAAVELDEATELYEQLRAARLTEAAHVAEQLHSLDLGSDDRGTDLDGAFLRAAEILQASRASKRFLILQTDMLPWGPQTAGSLNLKGIHVLVIFYDCREGDCMARKAAWTERFTAAGAASVEWHDPASSRLLADIFEAVR